MRRAFLNPLFPFAIAAIAILCLELVVFRFGNSSNYNTDFFDFSPVKPDVIQKHVIYDKFKLSLRSVPSDVVQVGDSSGFFGVIPAEVTAAANGISYLNLSCCADSGWNGHYYQAETALRQKHGAKLIVFHITPIWGPLGTPFDENNQLAGLIRDYILQEYWWHKVRPPSAGYRLRTTNLVYHGIWVDDLSYDIPPDQPTFPSIKGWREQYKLSRGWVPQPAAIDDPWLKGPAPLPCAIQDAFSEERLLGLWRDNALYRYLKRFAELARARSVRLVFITNPVPCVVQGNALYADVSEQLSQFSRDYPEVVIPFEFFREWPRHEFRDRWHLNIEGAIKHSRLIGEALRAVEQ